MNFFKTVLLIFSASIFAQSDLELPEAKWIAKSSGIVCNAYAPTNSKPLSHEEFNISFEEITTDSTLDNGLIKVTFQEAGHECRYSALMFADNEGQTIKLVESRAYALDGAAGCVEGKKLLDEQLKFNKYLYWGHPHHLSVMIPESSASEICGADAVSIGIDFTVTGRIGSK